MTTQSKHTPGPWEIKDGLVHVPHVTGHGGSYVYPTEAITRRIKTMTGKENNANARLIVASPKMLEALRLVLKCWDQGQPISAWGTLAKVEEAVAEAMGE